eukprot:1142626-Pelagomonas_calceolata.AAC.2
MKAHLIVTALQGTSRHAFFSSSRHVRARQAMPFPIVKERAPFHIKVCFTLIVKAHQDISRRTFP